MIMLDNPDRNFVSSAYTFRVEKTEGGLSGEYPFRARIDTKLRDSRKHFCGGIQRLEFSCIAATEKEAVRKLITLIKQSPYHPRYNKALMLSCMECNGDRIAG